MAVRIHVIIQAKRPGASQWKTIDRLTEENNNADVTMNYNKLLEDAANRLAQWNYHSMDLNGAFKDWLFRLKTMEI